MQVLRMLFFFFFSMALLFRQFNEMRESQLCHWLAASPKELLVEVRKNRNKGVTQE